MSHLTLCKIFAITSYQQLGEKIAKSIGLTLGQIDVRRFSDGEVWVKYKENIRGATVYIIGSTYGDGCIMELLVAIDAAKRASAKQVIVVIPYYGYARQDRKDQPRVSITARLVANLIQTAGADRVITLELHASQIQGFFNIPLDHLYASRIFFPVIKKIVKSNWVVAALDAGGIKRARAYSNYFGIDLAIVDKRRPKHNRSEVMNIIGSVLNKHVLIVEDMIDTGGTFASSVEALRKQGAKSITGVCVHAVLSGEALNKLAKLKIPIYTTDSIAKACLPDYFKILSIAPLLGETIKASYLNKSISGLFIENKD